MNWYRGFEACVREEVPLAGMTTYKVGGPAQFLAEPSSLDVLGALLSRAHDSGVPLRLLGRGTNLLVADSGVRGLVLRLDRSGFGTLRRSGNQVFAGAGCSLPALVKWSVTQGLSGLECLQGVPGTVGAALRMNAGGRHGEICQTVRSVRGFVRDGKPFQLSREECGFIYRNSGLSGRIVTECELELCEGDPAQSKKMLADILQAKCATQPLSARSAGCAFKNPKQPGVSPAGKLIDDLGLKGMRAGGAVVSNLHANFLVCEGAATAADLCRLIRIIRERVFEAHGIRLELEVEVWGVQAEELAA